MQDRISIKREGVRAALHALLPRVREAGQLAKALQPLIQKTDAPDQKTGDHVAHTSLTHADLLLEDRLGSDILMLFEDASFLGEERASDRISRFIREDRPYLITLDPINGTWQYSDGLPLYETIVTICDRSWNILGAIIYRPAFDEAFIAWRDEQERGASRVCWPYQLPSYSHLDLSLWRIQPRLHLDTNWRVHEPSFQHHGYEFVDIWSDYAAQPDWPYSQADVLLGKCRGMAWKAPWASFIDAAVFGFVVECANGVWRKGEFNQETLMYSYTIAASDAATADLLEKLIT